MSERLKKIDDMITKVMKRQELSHKDAIEYMLGVATGRLAALWRYEDTLPDGKKTKGILDLASPRKKRAPKTAKISTLVPASAETEKAAKKAAKRAPAKKRKAAKRKPKAEQLEITAEVAAE